MKLVLNLFIFIPFFGFIISLFLPKKKEILISTVTVLTVGLHLASFFTYVGYWISEGHPTLNIRDIVLFAESDYEFFIDFTFDKIAAVYLVVGSFLTFLVTLYSRSYFHREDGYKRFFNTILCFYLGYNIIILAGNLETLFIGWEILGISSFLLIAFYRNRYLPVKNAVKIFSIYRIGDVGILLAMWMSHHMWHENITFVKLNNYELVHDHLLRHSFIGISISLMILIAAAAKSAQLPFSSWLPRAMEGPTPSSAIFYGSLSVHLGVFLLLRTQPFWEHQLSIRILIAVLGAATSLIASGIARVQSSVKSQIAYSSISQIGLMFIEVAAGFEDLALIHFAGNAFLRTYQLLVSPSVVTYMIREQFYNFVPRPLTLEDSFPKKIEYSFYILSLKEWNLDSIMYKFFWNPLKWAGRKLEFVTVKRALLFFGLVYAAGLFCEYQQDDIPETLKNILPYCFSLIGLVMVLKAFAERKNVFLSWILIIMNSFWVVLAISFNEHFSFEDVYIYLSGIVIAGLLGYVCLLKIKKRERKIDLQQFHGHSYKHPKLAAVFLIACLGVSGFPISPTFLGEDLIFSHIHEDQIVLAFFTALSFIIDGIALIRIYARVFLGPHVKSQYEMAYRSS
jgi:NADH-quinone oxidoreductase subunit L